jgi:3-deoxy-7-phosphoheptulonate synthase
MQIHAACGSRLGGVSLEFTGEVNEDGFSVTECLGGSMRLSEEELELRYQVRWLELSSVLGITKELLFCE